MAELQVGQRNAPVIAADLVEEDRDERVEAVSKHEEPAEMTEEERLAHTAKTAAIGAASAGAVGAVLGAAAGGIGAVFGAAVGAIAGGAFGAAVDAADRMGRDQVPQPSVDADLQRLQDADEDAGYDDSSAIDDLNAPDLEDHAKLFQLLPVTTTIEVELTEAFQFVPEQSTAALVVHHQQASYFAVREAAEAVRA